MGRASFSTETVITPVNPERTFRIADECLIEIRLIENRREASQWIYEYEVNGEVGKIKKFITRLRNIEIWK